MSSDRLIPYRPEIDGLRAVAVLPVILFHAGLGFDGGYIGVDVFFVISGFLIGSLVVREIETGSFRLTRFWERRIRRLFPALAVCLVATAVVGFFVLIPAHLKESGAALVAQPLLSANFLFWSRSGYFETASEYQPLLHTWSLAVEEQFYLFLPLVLVPLLKGGRRRTLVVVCVFIVGSFAWCLYSTWRYPSAAFFLLPARIWELDLGVLLALIARAGFRHRAVNEFAAIAGLAAIAVSVFVYDSSTAFPGAAAAVPCLGTALFLFANSSSLTSSGRLLATPLPVWIGKISYPLYLWHWPCLVFFRYLCVGEAPLAIRLGALAASFLLAWATWRWIETPIRQKRFLAKPGLLAGVSAAVSALVVSAGILYDTKDGFPEKAAQRDTPPDSRDAPVAGFYAMKAWERRGGPFIAGDRSPESPKMLLWGDSHSMALIPVLDDLGRKHGVSVYAATEPGNGPLLGLRFGLTSRDGTDFEPVVRKLVDETPFTAALLVARWPVYLQAGEHGARNFILIDEEGRSVTGEKAKALFVRQLHATIRYLEDRGMRVHLLRHVAYQPLSVPETIAQARLRGRDVNAFAVPLTEHRREGTAVNRLLDEAVAGTGAVLHDPLPYFTDANGLYLMARDGLALYTDRSHLSPFGSRELRPLFEPLFRELSEKPDSR
jgi:peptidoglycan/LPS O-acetylase OafA/YrhL